ncbi:NADPH-dependent oxidoreductase [Niallia circulans]|jgi:FMN reductase|uniref:NADH-dependent FMN reductase n=1 Tax=Niallia circulans TaxID=1397 RepID=A0A0J1IM21_NIACI|nr:NAD(P)H-dependent oxidoreductase [Niallia circulans]KLV27016.1 NADH-dependent FMN reductase [Niallia circulans]MCM2979477.1 NAD(P)H-dependent oxidoreductase [Niallia circulans]MDR4317951.1 NAD(P)H-dependent oxidoreductase [Niallia circulans]MED3839022.1 NAD(P)H-dependent oxidoreductase [Niallia circulans]MED4242137.1 NAD(P)H-dependent oxidoreductase [Niallia circulans]
MKLVGISGSLVGSKTAKAVNEVLVAAKALDPTIQVELVDLREYEIEFVNGAPLSYYNDDTIKVVNTILSADALVIGTPVYQASISGVLKNLFDHLPVDAFKTKVAGMVITGGTDKHFLVMEHQLKPILTYFKALITVQNVFVHNDYFDEENEIIDKEVKERMIKLAEEIIYLQR